MALSAHSHVSLQRRLEPTSTSPDLSPSQLANFYRSCGGNYDELFKNTGEHGVSWIYRTLGCYHSLQPTRNAFEAPSIPCLTDDGYVRWQTLQLLLCPDEHVGFIQKAVELYDVPRRGGGGFFPKTIPTECFPVRPDPDMEKWHKLVISQITQDHMRRIKLSPYASPNPESGTSPGGYFARAPPVRPVYGQGRDSLSEEELARREAIRRRSSVPDVVSPGGTPMSEKQAAMKARSRSAVRPVSQGGHVRHRSNTGTSNRYQASPVPPRPAGSNTSIERSNRRRDPRHDRNISSGSRPDSADDASSEESYRRHKSSEEEDTKRRSRWGASFMPSFFLSKHQRRHSSDGRVPTLNNNKRSPRRSESIRKYKTEGSPDPRGRYLDQPPERSSSGVRFNDAFNRSDHPPRPDEAAYAPPPSSYRYSEPHPNAFPPPPVNPNMNSNAPKPNIPSVNQIPPTPPNGYPVPAPNYFAANSPQLSAKKDGQPLRVATVSGVNGRRYAPSETQSAIEPSLRRRDRTASMRNPATSTVL